MIIERGGKKIEGRKDFGMKEKVKNKQEKRREKENRKE